MHLHVSLKSPPEVAKVRRLIELDTINRGGIKPLYFTVEPETYVAIGNWLIDRVIRFGLEPYPDLFDLQDSYLMFHGVEIFMLDDATAVPFRGAA